MEVLKNKLCIHKRLYLLGFMGSGKSTISKRLSERLHFAYLDLDDLLETNLSLSIPEIFRRNGEMYFRKQEQKAINDLKNVTNAVIALGGGTPCYFDNMQALLNSGVCIYIKLNAEILKNRLIRDSFHRPLVNQYSSDSELLGYIRKKLDERSVYYEQADYIIDGSDDPGLISKRISNLFLN